MVAAILLAVFTAPHILARGARWVAARHVAAGADHTARLWLAWSAWLSPGDGRTDLADAACLRHVEHWDHWGEVVETAKRNGAPPQAVQQELRLGLLQSGQQRDALDRELVSLSGEGVPQREVASAVIYACLAQEKVDAARLVLDAWSVSHPNDPHQAYMSGVLWRYVADPARAETAFNLALVRAPRHEMARQALADLYATQHRLEESLAQEIALAHHPGTRDAAEVRLARLLRKLGRTREAQQILQSAVARRGINSDVGAELGQIELDAGRCAEALRLLEPGVSSSPSPTTATVAAVAAALQSQIVSSQQAFNQIDRMQANSLRSYDLRVRLAIDGADREAADELSR
ncbi:MAG: hypothetical protein ACYC6Y_24350, partial [Thermoguttaceae bacterium]